MKISRIFLMLVLVISLHSMLFLRADLNNISTLDRIRAVVNGKIITQGDIDIMLTNVPPAQRKDIMYLNSLINDILLREKAKELEKFNIFIDRSWIEKRVQDLINEGYKQPVSYLRKMLEMEAVRIHIKRYIIKRNIIVSPDDIKDYYKRHIDDFCDPAQVLIRCIAIHFFPRPDIEAGIEEIRSTLKEIHQDIADKDNAKKIDILNEKIVNTGDKKHEMIDEILQFLKTFMGSRDPLLKKEAERLYEKYKYFKTEKKADEICKSIQAKLKSGEDFGSLVIKHSEGTFKNAGGKWDWFAKGGLSGKLKIIEKAAFGLKDQEVSVVLDTGDTKYIIQKIGDKPASIRALTDREVQEKIYQILSKRKEREEEIKLLRELRKSAYIRIYK
ncbi:peptidylprolyl isomerase [Planctomycetota bacterium]